MFRLMRGFGMSALMLPSAATMTTMTNTAPIQVSQQKVKRKNIYRKFLLKIYQILNVFLKNPDYLSQPLNLDNNRLEKELSLCHKLYLCILNFKFF